MKADMTRAWPRAAARCRARRPGREPEGGRRGPRRPMDVAARACGRGGARRLAHRHARRRTGERARLRSARHLGGGGAPSAAAAPLRARVGVHEHLLEVSRSRQLAAGDRWGSVGDRWVRSIRRPRRQDGSHRAAFDGDWRRSLDAGVRTRCSSRRRLDYEQWTPRRRSTVPEERRWSALRRVADGSARRARRTQRAGTT